MGNISSHAEISAHVITQLAKVRPDEEFLNLELGNFLTDVSQFRDPYSCFHAKKSVRMQAILNTYWGQVPVISPVFFRSSINSRISPWLNELLGEAKANRRIGTFSNFFTHLSRFSAHLLFAEDSPFRIGRAATSLLPEFANLPIHDLSPSEVNRVFDNAFTQYYPHEHLDFPPYHDPEREGPDYRKVNLYQKQSSGLIGYLEEQVQYISEELTKIELAWVHNRSNHAADPSRRDLMVRLGHILHAVEDYFFHSNFVEIYQWQRLCSRYPSKKVKDADDNNWLLLHNLEGTTENAGDIMLRRRLARRLRYPVYISSGSAAGYSFGTSPFVPSPYESEDATNQIYTGGFGRNDIFHTIYGALVSMEDLLASSQLGKKLINSDLVLVRVMFNEQERKQMVADEKYRNKLVKQHEEQLNSGLYPKKIQEVQNQGLITAAGAEALRQAFELDKMFANKHPGFPGLGSFLILFFSSMQDEIEKSAKRVTELNRNQNSIIDTSKSMIGKAITTDDGASAEMVGTHSLMAKDDPKKQPLRYAAMALAKDASASLAVLMAERVNGDSNPDHGLDWDSIVRFYLHFPKFRSNSWENEIITYFERNQRVPNVKDVTNRPNFRMLGAEFQAKKLQDRRKGKGTNDLEDRYKGLEANEDR